VFHFLDRRGPDGDPVIQHRVGGFRDSLTAPLNEAQCRRHLGAILPCSLAYDDQIQLEIVRNDIRGVTNKQED